MARSTRYRIVTTEGAKGDARVKVFRAVYRWWWLPKWEDVRLTWDAGDKGAPIPLLIESARKWIASNMVQPPVVVYDTARVGKSGELTLTDSPRPTSLFKPKGGQPPMDEVGNPERLAPPKPPVAPKRPEPSELRKLGWGL